MSFTDSLKTLVSKAGFFVKKNAPTILLLVGIGTSAGAIVTASNSSRKLDETIKPANTKLEEIKTKVEKKEIDEKQAKKERVKVYTKTGWSLVKLYSLPVALYGTSVACFVGGNKILSNRVAGLTAGYSLLQNSFNDYRSRVAKSYGSDVEKRLYNGETREEVETKDADGKTGKAELWRPSKLDGSIRDGFSFIFDESMSDWEDNAQINLAYLDSKENYINRRLECQGYITVHEILFDIFHVNPSEFSDEAIKASYQFGWLRNPKKEGHDNYVNIGLYDGDQRSEAAIDMQRGYEKNFYVHFNNPYYIYDEIPSLMKKIRC